MIYFLYGSDTEKARAKAHELMNALILKKPDALMFAFDSDRWDAAEFESLINGRGLFESNHIIFLNRVLENAEAEEAILSKLADMQESTNISIVLEGEPKKAIREKIEKHSAKSQEFAQAAKAGRPEFNNFAMADALGARNKKELWSLYQGAMFEERAPEELHGMLFWQMKSMLQAAQAKNADDAGQKAFVFGKSARYAKNYSLSELKQKSSELVGMYHEARRGGEEMEGAVERWILGI